MKNIRETLDETKAKYYHDLVATGYDIHDFNVIHGNAHYYATMLEKMGAKMSEAQWNFNVVRVKNSIAELERIAANAFSKSSLESRLVLLRERLAESVSPYIGRQVASQIERVENMLKQ